MSIRHHRLFLGLAGVAGVVVAHTLADLVAFPDGGHRAQELQSTGHGYWPAAVGLALVAALTVIGVAVVRGARRGLSGFERRSRRGHGRLSRVLIVWQLGLYTAVELAERVGMGQSPAVLLHERQFALGLAAQVVVAAAALLLIVGVELSAERAAARWRSPRCASMVAASASRSCMTGFAGRWCSAPAASRTSSRHRHRSPFQSGTGPAESRSPLLAVWRVAARSRSSWLWW